VTIQTTYTQAHDGLAKLLDQVTHNREVIIIQRRGEEEVAMIAASELQSLMETAYLLRSQRQLSVGLHPKPQILPGKAGKQPVFDATGLRNFRRKIIPALRERPCSGLDPYQGRTYFTVISTRARSSEIVWRKASNSE